MASKLTRLKEAEARVERLVRDLNSFSASQHSVRIDKIKKMDGYKQIRSELGRARSAVRRIKREPDS